MYQKIVRINSVDNIEQPGILYSPTAHTNKIVIHVHGLNGNFYENRFIDALAKTYIDNNYAFLTFNNRGRDCIAELMVEDKFTIIGSCIERFKDCILDIDGVVEWAKTQGYKEIILEGHSYGCNKVLYYYNKKNNSSIKKVVLLAPCDIPSLIKKVLGDKEYNNIKEEATKLIYEKKEKKLINFPIMPNGKISAETYYYDYLPDGENDFIRYYDDIDKENNILNNIKIPVLIIFGDLDEYVLTQPIEIVKNYLINSFNNSSVKIIKGADHLYTRKCYDLCKIINENI